MTTKLALTSGGGALFPEDVFASWVYSGTSAAQNIQNGVNLSAYGGLVWTKARNNNIQNLLCDSIRGANLMLSTTTGYTNGQLTYNNSVTGFNSDGYALGIDNSGLVNSSGYTFSSWAFRRATRFFDIVTYTGNGTNQALSHRLGIAPGFIMVKRTDATGGSFFAYHISAGAGNVIDINTGSAATSSTTAWNNTSPTSGVFYVGASTSTNASGGTYVAYLFAHDTSIDGIIQCGSYTGTGVVGTGPSVSLGWEPQWLLIKPNGALGSDYSATITDSLRGMSYADTRPQMVDESVAEGNYSAQVGALPDGFRLLAAANDYNAALTYYYVAIRRPIKRPTTGTQVFFPHAYTGTNAALTVTAPGFSVDMFIGRQTTGTPNIGLVDRMRGAAAGFYINQASGQTSSGSTNDLTSFVSTTGYSLGTNGNFLFNGASTSQIGYALKRARGFFDQVRYVGNGSARTISHQLGATPELILVTSTSLGGYDWLVYHSALGAGYWQCLNWTSSGRSAAGAASTTHWNNTAPTQTQFSVGTSSDTNVNTAVFYAYLFATCPGVSKVGSYTGNGSSQTVDCGFSSGARFVMVKRANTTGAATTDFCNGWCVADTARGLVTANDPVFAMNRAVADGSYDWIDPANSGFIINQEANTDLNVNGVLYIYLAIA